MSIIAIDSYERKLDFLFSILENQIKHDVQLSAHWTRYLCILVSGYLEVSIRTIYREYTRSKSSSPNIVNYVEKNLRMFRNPKMGKILELCSFFDKEWRKSMESDIDDKIKTSIDSIVNIRNEIAHGKDTGIYPSTLKEYYSDSRKFIKYLCKQCLE